MLQNTRAHAQLAYEAPDQGLDLAHYFEIAKRRFFYFFVPFFLIAGVGFAVTMLLPPVYVSEGKILVESQQIPTDLVKPTVTATAKERIQVIEQRVMTRENLLAVVNKFKLFAGEGMSGTELLDEMRKRSQMKPFELDTRRRLDAVTIALTVGFEHRRPEIAMQVANELVTLILAEDARNRTNRAMETTKFLAREVKKLETDLGAIEGQIAEHQRRYSATPSVPERLAVQLATLKAELHDKSAIFSSKHPELARIKRQIAALEQVTTPAQTTQGASADAALETLQNQRASIQKSLEKASEKLSAGRLGESLERDQFSERLEVLEQAVLPQKPIKPNRPKILAAVLALAAMTGGGLVLALESLNKTIRSRRELLAVAGGHMVVAIPYIVTKAETLKKRRRIISVIVFLVSAILAALAAAHFFLRPLDELWALLLVRLLP